MLHRFTARPRAALAAGVSAGALFAAAGSASAQEISIGSLMPMTGDLAAFGETTNNGAQLAVDQINAAGGVLDGQQLELVVGDTQTVPQAAIDAAQRLVSVEGVAAMIGALSSGNTIPVAQSVASVENVPVISPASTSPVITGLEDGDFLFRTVPSDAFQGVALSSITHEAGIESVSVIYVNNDYGEGLAQAFGDAFEAAGGEVVGSVPYEQGRASYRGELQQISGGDALVLLGYPENGVTILRQALEEGFFNRFVFPDGMKAPEIIEQIGAQYLDGSIGTAPEAPEGSETAALFNGFYEEAYGEQPPKPYIDTGYDAAFLIALAIEASGSTEGPAIRDALRDVANPPGEEILPGEWEKAVGILAEGGDIDYVGASGSVNFDAAGDVSGTFSHWEIQDGEIVTVKIFDPSS